MRNNSYKILVISDSHGNVEVVNDIVNKNKFDYLFYLGDGIGDLSGLIYQDNVFYVKGNCDFFSDADIEAFVQVGNYKFLLVHGHTFGVKNGMGSLLEYAKSENVNVVLYGHTHKYQNEIIGNIEFLNPGALTKRRTSNQSYAVIIIEDGKMKINKISL